MNKKNIKELADLSISQCKEKLISLIKEFGDVEELNKYEISNFTIDELYKIITHL